MSVKLLIQTIKRTAAEGSPNLGTYASVTITFASALTSFEIETDLPFAASGYSGASLSPSDAAATAAANFPTAFFSAVAIGATVVITHKTAGSVGNATAISVTGTGVSSSSPTFEGGGDLRADVLGQQCIVGGSVPLTFKACNAADLTEWLLVGPAGVVEDNESPGTFRRTIFDGGATSSEIYTPTD